MISFSRFNHLYYLCKGFAKALGCPLRTQWHDTKEMRIVEPSFEIWLQEPGLDGIYRQVERCGRVCYKSEDHATETSARPFVERMIRSSHTAMLEHATVYLAIPTTGNAGPAAGETAEAVRSASAASAGVANAAAAFYRSNSFSRTRVKAGTAYVTTNLRVLVENGRLDDLQLFLCNAPTPHHERRVTVHFTTQVAITREFNRHRANSMAEQSTRYCNYAKAKFGNEISINLPTWVKEIMPKDAATQLDAQEFLTLAHKVADGTANDWENWLFANLAAERAYMNLTEQGHKPQEARVVLPLDTNTELVHTAFMSDWKHFFDLRALDKTGPAHPDAKALALPLYNKMKEMGLMD